MSLAEVLADCQAMIEPQALKNGIALHFPLLDGALLVRPTARGSSRCCINLLSNAIKYNRAGGRVEVRVSAAGWRMRISVQDTGEGLASDKPGATVPAVQPAGPGERARKKAPASAWW
jgi:signal transduction histidine kinase